MTFLQTYTKGSVGSSLARSLQSQVKTEQNIPGSIVMLRGMLVHVCLAVVVRLLRLVLDRVTGGADPGRGPNIGIFGNSARGTQSVNSKY
jgi:hypothetical protein